MNHSKEVNKTDKSNPIDEYFQCLSYCDIHPKGIDNDCEVICICLLYTSPSPRDTERSRMPSSA